MSGPRVIDDPQPGHYRTRLVRGGPWAPARIWIDDSERMRCEVDGEERDPFAAWPGLHPITEAEYDHMIAVIEWARKHAPDSPEASPRRPIDFGALPPPTFGAEPSPGPGHNLPPPDRIPDDIWRRAMALERAAAFDAHADDEESAGGCVLLAKQITLLEAQLKAVAEAAKEPHERELAAIRQAFGEVKDALARDKAKLCDLLAAHLTATGADQARSDYGPVASWRTDRKLQIDDPDAIPRPYLKPDEAKLERDLRAGHKIDGARLVDRRRVVVS